jgi:hypothetical protein
MEAAMTIRSIVIPTALLLAVGAAAPLPALALQDRSKCVEAKAGANEFDIKTFCPRSEWPATYSADQAKRVVTAPFRAFISVFK